MSVLPPGGRLLDGGHAVPPRKQRILAPSQVDISDSGGYSTQCVASLVITDPVNLEIYFVPLTGPMVTELRRKLLLHDQSQLSLDLDTEGTK